MSRLLPVFALLLLTGCMGDPDLGGAAEDLVLEVPVERDVWQAAPAGCEGVAGQLRPAAGEPLLGVLVGPAGRALCVDSVSLIRQEATTRVLRDPTPTPLLPEDEVEADWL